MDRYFIEHFSWLKKLDEKNISSWHAFKYQFNPDKLDDLTSELKRINERLWNIRVRYQPGLDFDEIEEFIHGDEMTSRCGTNCLALSTRMDIAPDGQVMACKFFSEFSPGSLNESGLKEVWDSEAYDKIRDIINNGGLTPACSKCSVLLSAWYIKLSSKHGVSLFPEVLSGRKQNLPLSDSFGERIV